MSLRERAASALTPDQTAILLAAGVPAAHLPSGELEDISYDGNAITDAPAVPVQVAFARVMADVQSIAKKDQRNDVGGRYNFRGVDAVVNAVGPALRRHGVLMLPTKILSLEQRESRTSGGKVMQDVTVTVQWTVIGPKADQLPLLESAGQATDTSDKGTAKAISVAQRVLLLTSLQIPTQSPDVDRGHERGERPGPTPAQYRDEICDPRTSLGRLRQIRAELRQHNIGGAVVVNEVGDDEPVLAMCERIGKDRSGAGE